MKIISYVLMTAVRNECAFIAQTIEAVLEQTIRPMKWVIVSDNSTDNTDEIIIRYASQYSFIQYIRKDSFQKGFISKVEALKLAYSELSNNEFDFIGTLDGDITFEKDYFEKLFNEFEKNEKLGIGGGVCWELVKYAFKEHKISLTSVPGGVQLFRKKCFNDVGGYFPLEYGGEDGICEFMARMNGWSVQAFLDLKAYHHREVGKTNKDKLMKISINNGKRFYYMGYSLLFEIFRSVFRLKRRPMIIGSLVELFAFIILFLKREERHVPLELQEFIKKEQYSRLRSYIV
jgi:poly-beta-1,6-N-acetyl-D-glucosamine synthase